MRLEDIKAVLVSLLYFGQIFTGDIQSIRGSGLVYASALDIFSWVALLPGKFKCLVLF